MYVISYFFPLLAAARFPNQSNVERSKNIKIRYKVEKQVQRKSDGEESL